MGQLMATLTGGGGRGRRGDGGSGETLMASGGDAASGGKHGGGAHHAGFSFWVAVAFAANYIMGCGFLGIPSAFVKSGVLLGPLLICLGGVVMNATKDYVLEAMARAEAMAKAAAISSRALRHAAAGDASGLAGPTGGGRRRGLIVPEQADYLIDHHRKYEVTDLCLMLVGPTARSLYALILSLYMYGGLCAYASVWASSFTANVPVAFLNGGATCNIEQSGLTGGCVGPYLLWLAVFAAIAIPLACVDLEEQVAIQVLMFAARVLVVALLTGTVAVGMAGCTDGVVFAEVPPGKPQHTALADAAGLATVIPVSIFSFIFHHSIPGLSQPVANKTTLPRMFAVTFVIITVFYASVGLLVAVFFGPAVNSQCSLNWREYVGCMPRPANYTLGVEAAAAGGTSFGRSLLTTLASMALPGGASSAVAGGGGGPRGLLAAAGLTAPACTDASTWAADGTCVDWQSRPVYAKAISFIVLIFPALDVLSAFPLNAITLGNNLMSAVLGDKALIPPVGAEEDDDEDDEDGEGAVGEGGVRFSRSGGGRSGGIVGSITDTVCRRDGSAARQRKAAGRRRSARLAAMAAGGGSGGSRSKSLAGGSSSSSSSTVGGLPPGPLPWYLRSRRNHWLTKTGFRLLAAVPPVVVTAFVSDLGLILTYTGLVGIFIAFTIPAMLTVWARAKQRAVFGLVSGVLLPDAGVADAADVDAAVPLPSVRTPAHAAAVAAAAAEAKAVSAEGGGTPVAADSDSEDRAPLVASAGGVGISGGGPGSDPVVAAVCAAARPGGISISLREAMTAVPAVDGVLRDTPYTSWAARGRGAEAILGASLLLFVYVLVMTIVDTV
jgi:amino acid permease